MTSSWRLSDLAPDLRPTVPTPSPLQPLLPEQAQASQGLRAGRPGPGAPVLSCLRWQDTAGGGPSFSSHLSFLCWWTVTHIHLLPNKGPILAGDYR